MKLLPYRILDGRTARHARLDTPGLCFRCSVCGLSKPVPSGGVGTGYGRNRRGSLVCYACCGEQDRRAMLRTGKAVLYVTKEPSGHSSVSNWPGTLRFHAYARESRHNWSNVQRTDAWFVGPDGRQWYGVNLGDNQILRCRRIKG